MDPYCRPPPKRRSSKLDHHNFWIKCKRIPRENPGVRLPASFAKRLQVSRLISEVDELAAVISAEIAIPNHPSMLPASKNERFCKSKRFRRLEADKFWQIISGLQLIRNMKNLATGSVLIEV